MGEPLRALDRRNKWTFGVGRVCQINGVWGPAVSSEWSFRTCLRR